jgi:hypothetical protein
MEEDGFGLTGMAWNRESRFWAVWNGLELRNLLLDKLKWLVTEEVGFNLTGMAWNGGSRFWPHINGLRKMGTGKKTKKTSPKLTKLKKCTKNS